MNPDVSVFHDKISMCSVEWTWLMELEAWPNCGGGFVLSKFTMNKYWGLQLEERFRRANVFRIKGKEYTPMSN